MTQGEKQLLFKDLCARLPYEVVIHTNWKDVKLDHDYCEIGMLYYEHYSEEAKKECSYNENDCSIIISGCYYGDIKPYLRPLSSMTDEEEDEWLRKVLNPLLERTKTLITRKKDFELRAKSQVDPVDWLNAHHFDYRGLIERGLALEAPAGMYKIE